MEDVAPVAAHAATRAVSIIRVEYDLATAQAKIQAAGLPELLAQRFRTGFEQTCHRLTPLRRPGAEGIQVYFVRVDLAGGPTDVEDGSRPSGRFDALSISLRLDSRHVSSGSTVRGLVINRFSGNGIRVFGGGGNVIRGNFVGTDVTGVQTASGRRIRDTATYP